MRVSLIASLTVSCSLCTVCDQKKPSTICFKRDRVGVSGCCSRRSFSELSSRAVSTPRLRLEASSPAVTLSGLAKRTRCTLPPLEVNEDEDEEEEEEEEGEAERGDEEEEEEETAADDGGSVGDGSGLG